MKNIIIFLFVLTMFAHAKADSFFFNETSIGCTAMGTTNMMLNEGNEARNFALGCLMGGAAGWVMNKYYTNKIQDRYEERINTLEGYVDSVTHERAINSSKGIGENGLVIKRTRVPGKNLGNGKWQEPTFILEVEMPGKNLILDN